VRVNGRAVLTADADLRARFERGGRLPATVIVITLKEIYAQCARAPVRAGLWHRDDSAAVPTMGDILSEMTNGTEGGKSFDAKYASLETDALW
jgi:predicted pyridoxine 5'-phosphate oxidase superfamily flavin-nucleotide-binding protein